MRLDREYFKATAFLDLLFNILLVFFFMFIISFVSIKTEQNKATIESKAEFIVTITWTPESADDVDVWVEDPQKALLWYRDKYVGLMHLDRDDVGKERDEVTLPSGEKIKYAFNQEIVTIRGIIPGEWVINLHMFAKRDADPINVEISMDKLNPTVTNIFKQKLVMAKDREEVTIARITLSEKGEVLSMDNIPKELIKQQILSQGGGPY